ncbi:MAG: thiamine pyrophosphate-binding protein [Spirochaetes bacterium]|nr:thiamine pyrophosphate-binding protein [Spirochaetota bacterium]
MGRMTGGRYIAETLKRYGITHVFFVEAILRRAMVEMEKLGIKRVLTHSEKAAAYMADGYARASNRPAVCMAQSVGAANLAAGLQDGFLGHVPIIAFTGRKPPLFQYRNSYQEIMHNSMFEAVTKYNVEVDSSEQLPYLLLQAFREATTGTPAPVHIDFLGFEGGITDLEEAELDLVVEERYFRCPAYRTIPEKRDIRQAAELLSGSTRPVIVAGRGAVVSDAGPEIRRLAETRSIPVVSSVDAKSLLPDDHPLYVGPVGTYNRPCANRIVSEADLVFFIGCGAGDQVTNNWTLPAKGTKVLQIDINPSELGRNYPGTVGICGDAKTSLTLLFDMLGKRPKRDEWSKHAATLREEWEHEVAPQYNSDAVPVRPERLCREITKALPSDAVVVSDTGYSAIWAGTLIRIKSPDQLFLRASGSLGWAFPAALGVKCALPHRPVVCFSGDGAFWYHFQELETAVRWDIPTVTVVNNNSVFGQTQIGVRRAYGDNGGREQDHYLFRETNFARIAEELGAVGIRVESPREIEGAIRHALDLNLPVVIDVVTDPESFPILM